MESNFLPFFCKAQYFDDLRPYGLDADFIGQTIHTTNKKKYNDTVNISIFPDKVEIFSISQIGGAYCDDGQNYKNIVKISKISELPKSLNAPGGRKVAGSNPVTPTTFSLSISNSYRSSSFLKISKNQKCAYNVLIRNQNWSQMVLKSHTLEPDFLCKFDKPVVSAMYIGPSGLGTFVTQKATDIF